MRDDLNADQKEMLMPARGPIDPDHSLATRAAWLHYIGGLTQASVAKRLGLTSVKTHRLIARAVAEGVVKVSIEGEIVECAMLEDQLCAKYDLDYCEVAPDLGEPGLPLRALGMAGAAFMAPRNRARRTCHDRAWPWPHHGGRRAAASPAGRPQRRLRIPAWRADAALYRQPP